MSSLKKCNMIKNSVGYVHSIEQVKLGNICDLCVQNGWREVFFFVECDLPCEIVTPRPNSSGAISTPRAPNFPQRLLKKRAVEEKSERIIPTGNSEKLSTPGFRAKVAMSCKLTSTGDTNAIRIIIA